MLCNAEHLTAVQHSPLSQLPTEIFIHIIHYVLDATSTCFGSRVKNRCVNPLYALLAVNKTWYNIIVDTPSLWSTLHLAGDIDSKTAATKVRLWTGRSNASTDSSTEQKGSNHLGIKRLVINSAQDFPDQTLVNLLQDFKGRGAFRNLQSFDMSLTRSSLLAERSPSVVARVFSDAILWLRVSSAASLRQLAIHCQLRPMLQFKLSDIANKLPALDTLFISGTFASCKYNILQAPWLDVEHEYNAAAPVSRLRALRLDGHTVIEAEVCRPEDYPNLEDLEMEAAGLLSYWPLLSAPNLRRFHTVMYGEQAVSTLPLPDVATAWKKVESLRLGGARRFAPRLLDAAIAAQITFAHLTALDLSYTSLSTRQLALFGSDNAPQLSSVILHSTTCGALAGTISLPPLVKVKLLDVSHTMWMDDNAIQSLIELAPSIERLYANGLSEISGRPLMELVRHRVGPVTGAASSENESNDPSSTVSTERIFSQLVELRIEGCVKVQPDAVKWLRGNMVRGGLKHSFTDPLLPGRKRTRRD